MDFESLPLFGGPFEIVETYVYYDGPKTFAMRSPTWDFYYFVNAVTESESGDSVTFLATGVNRVRFEAVRSGLIKFRDAYTQATPGALYSVTWTYDDDGQERVVIVSKEPAEVEATWLPDAGVGLDIGTATAPEFDRNEVVQLASAQGRTVFAVKVDTGNARITQFPQRQTGQVQIALAGEFDALLHEIAPSGATARDMYPVVLGLRASSFVMLLGVETPTALAEPVEVSAKIFNRLNTLLSLAGSDDKTGFLANLASHGHKARNRFRDLLEPLVETRSGITLTTSLAHAGTSQSVSVAPEAVRATLDAIRNVVPERETILVNRGVLIGKNVRLQRFEIFDTASRRSYYGHMTDDARQQAANIPVNENSLVKATILREWAFAERQEATGVRFALLQVEGLGGAAQDADLPTSEEDSTSR